MKLIDLFALRDHLKQEYLMGKKVVLANGCFDIIHVGHIRYLEEAKRAGDILVVAVNTDESIRKIKGDGKPYTPQNERVEILSALSCVDYIILFSEPSAENVILTLKPDFQAKGTDYTVDSVPEKQIVESYGGKIIITGDSKDHSSSSIIEGIKSGKT
jgi:rfaE bifunctional protein nucleotidyltransferase chain/domain